MCHGDYVPICHPVEQKEGQVTTPPSPQRAEEPGAQPPPDSVRSGLQTDPLPRSTGRGGWAEDKSTRFRHSVRAFDFGFGRPLLV